MYWNGSMVMECTKVVFDASDPEWVVIRFMGEDNAIPKFSVSLAPQGYKKFEFFNGIEGFDKTILLEQVNDTSAVEPAEASQE